MSDQNPNLDSLFEAAVQIESATERAAFLERACGNDAELRRQVEQLLESHEQAGSFLDRPPAGLDATTGPSASDGNLAASLEAGLASAFGEDEAVVVGEAGNSVLKMLGLTMDVPRVALRDAAAEGHDPVQRPSSTEIPRHDADSRYQLQGEIARGGMGAIIKGRDTDLGRDLAIKVLLDEHKAKPEVIQRFVEEAQIGGQLQHPGITPVYELGQFADQRPFFSMKLVKGKTLSALLEERADPAVDRMKLLGTFEQVCQTMAYAHSRGVIHRDLKPANIMVGAFGEVQVMDWGLAKVLPAGGVADEKKASTRHKGETVIQTMRDAGSDTPDKFGSAGSDTQMGSIMGTPAYMPPEQALGEVDRLDERADVFGLGAILCEILTGDPPYVAADATQVFRMARRGKLDECFARLDACSAEAELIDLAKRALAAEPEHRYRNASAMADSITGYLASVQERLKQAELAKAEANARAEHATRRRRLVMAIAGLMLVIAVGAGFSALEFRRQREANWALVEENKKKRKEAEDAKQSVEIEKQKVEEEKEHVQRYSEQLEREREALRQEQYLSDMLLIQQSYDDGSIGRVRELLSRYIPLDGEKDRRTFEWYYWWRASHHELKAIGPRPDDTRGASVSPDQRLLAVFGWTGRLEIRDAQTLDLIANTSLGLTIPTESDMAFMDMAFMAFSRDGAILGTMDNNRVRLWDTGGLKVGEAQGLTELAAIERASRLSAIAFSPTDSSMALADLGGQITIWDPKYSKEPRSSVSCPGITELAFSPDGSLLAALRSANPYSGADSEILIYDLAQLELRKTLKGRQRNMISLAWGGAADRSVIATGSDVGNVCLWDGESFEDRDTLTAVGQRIQSLTFSPDGSRLAARLGEEQAVQIWETDTSGLVTTIRGHEAKVVGAGFIDQAKKLVSCGFDGSIKTWDLSQARPFLEARSAGRITAEQIVVLMDANRDGKISKDEALAELKPHFEQIDTNGDGFIDAKEVQGMVNYANSQQAGSQGPASMPGRVTAEQIVSDMDANRDGKISKDEASAELKPHFEQIDTNGDGTIDVKEAQVMANYANSQQAGSKGPASTPGRVTAEQIVSYMDANRDGKISKDEASAELKPHFEQIDTNGDGTIDVKEAQVMVNYANSQPAGSKGPASMPGRVAAEQIVSDMDANRDGKISKDEASEELKPHFEQIDTNGDGAIDPKEARGMAYYFNNQQAGTTDQGSDDRVRWLFGRDGPVRRSVQELLPMPALGPAEIRGFTGLSDNGQFLAVLTPDGDRTVRLEVLKKEATDSKPRPFYAKDGIQATVTPAVDIAVSDDGSRVVWTSAKRLTGEQVVGIDANRDGKISRDEASAELKPHFEQIDTNKDGVIDVKEAQVVADYIKKQAASELVIHDVSTGTTVSTMTPFILLVALSADGNRMAALGGLYPRLWVLDISDGKIRDTDLEAGERRWLKRSRALQLETQFATACAFSPDGQYLAVATSHNGIVIIDCESRQKVDSLKGHAREVWALSFSQDGSLLVSGGDDGTVRVWGFPSRQLRTTLRGHEMSVTGVVFSGEPGDGQSITSMGIMGKILVWPTATKAEVENRAEYWKARAERHERNGDAANARADWLRFASNPNVPDTERFEVLTRYEHWEEAAEVGTRMLGSATTPNKSLAWLRVSPVIALTENEELYRQFCSRMAKQFAKTKDIVSAQRTCKACLLIPDAIDIEQLPHNPISTWLDEGKTPVTPAQWSTRGLVAYRRGNAQVAITYVNRSEELDPSDIAKALNRAILALAHHRLGDPEQARKDVQQATEILDRAEASNVRPANYWDLLIARILRDEARTLIEDDTKPSNRAVP